MDEYEVVIGLEVHVELLTESKMFCSCSTKFGSSPNTNTCPICTGMPGVLPVINEKAVELAVKTGIAFNSNISKNCRFARKNYFYPDLPKNYQISQYEQPIIKGGYIKIGEKKINLTRIHLEEDAGKLIHSEEGAFSYVDFNRSGIPLLEIVTEPDIRSPEEAELFLLKLKQTLEYLRISDCNMEEGSLRCDANISVRKKGEKKLGVKVEVKNMNSFKAVRKALSYEAKRQISILRKGEKVIQQTRLWNEKQQRTEVMRTKEEAHDYRYFPEPDLLPVEINDDFIKKVEKEIGELPEERRERIKREYNLPDYDIDVLMNEKIIIDYFEECAKTFKNYKMISNWIMGEIMALVKEEKGINIFNKISPKKFVGLLNMVEKGKITATVGKEVLKEVFKAGKLPDEIIKEKNLLQIDDASFIENIVKEVIEENPKAVDDYRKGKEKVIGFLIGQVMKKMKGKANPSVVKNTFEKMLK
ncbi:Asp-tRNA(Asn)/Glu-tRNA(Gln) amidotransferase subunit GatB [bacterium]|nr:Asp-tRNA(Asn)/Glu-tRNA(Gln) amidotransferase subunit GatB [bacterium]